MVLSEPSDIFVLFGLAVLAAVYMNGHTSLGDDRMSITFYESDIERPMTLDVEPIPIRPVSQRASIPDAEPELDKSGCLRPFANEQLNSRMPSVLPDAEWEIMWQSNLPDDMPAAFVLRGAGSTVVHHQSSWRLLDQKGRFLARGPRESGYVVIDVENELFYVCHPFGFISARELSNGDERFATFASFGEGFNRTILSRAGQRMLILSVELPTMIDQGAKDPEYTIIETQDLGNPIRTDEERFLTSATNVRRLMCRGMPFFVASQGTTIAMVAENHIFIADEDLRITDIFRGEFVPLAMSLDEAVRIHLIVRTEDEPRALWVVSPKGELVMSTGIPTVADYTPPVIGYDHRVYITLGDRVLAISQEGETLWNQHSGGAIAGVVVTADNQLLVASGRRSPGCWRICCSFSVCQRCWS